MENLHFVGEFVLHIQRGPASCHALCKVLMVHRYMRQTHQPLDRSCSSWTGCCAGRMHCLAQEIVKNEKRMLSLNYLTF